MNDDVVRPASKARLALEAAVYQCVDAEMSDAVIREEFDRALANAVPVVREGTGN